MNQETLNLEQYRCRKCGRLFYINASQRHPLDVDFGCPYGCDSGTARERDIAVETRVAGGRTVSDDRGIKCYYVVLSFSGQDFADAMHRRPHDQKEFDRWAFFMEKGIFEGNIGWDNIHECAYRAMRDRG